MSTTNFRFFEKESEILKSVATRYKSGSEEELAIKTSALALLFAVSEHPEEFNRFLQNYREELTSEQKGRLAEWGLDMEKPI